MSEKPRGKGWRGRRRWAWILFAAGWVAMAIGLFLPSYGTPYMFKPPGTENPGVIIHVGWECAWTVVWIWEGLLDGSMGGIGYSDSLMLSYLPINTLFVISALFLWLTGRSRRLGWVFRVVYMLIVLQVLSWWLLHVFDEGMREEILIGYWFWLGAYVVLAAAFWVMPRVGRRQDSPARGAGKGEEGAQ